MPQQILDFWFNEISPSQWWAKDADFDQLTADERSFLLVPYMHSESKHIHALAELLYKAHAPDNNYQFELKHKFIIDRFGRYPHRNAILGRASTDE